MNQPHDWSFVPVDDIGYIPSRELLDLNTEEFRELVSIAERNRYEGWRNTDNRWRETLGLDTTKDSTVLDFGCGLGLDALQYAKAGNHVILADQFSNNCLLAARTLNIHKLSDYSILPVEPLPQEYPECDVFHACGVLHHTPDIIQILATAANSSKELRLMLYTDIAWKVKTGSNPPLDRPSSEHPDFEKFVRAMDDVGDYADWYSPEKLQAITQPFLLLDSYSYLPPDKMYMTAILHPIRSL